MPRKNFFKKNELIKVLNLPHATDVDLLISLGLLTPLRKDGRIMFSGREVRHLEKVVAGGHLAYSRIILDILQRLEKVEKAVTVMSNIIQPSFSDVLYGIEDNRLVELTVEALADRGEDLPLAVIFERLKIAANLGVEHIDVLRRKMKDPSPPSTWLEIVEGLRKKLLTKRGKPFMDKDPLLYKQVRAVLKNAEENLGRLAVIEHGPGALTRPPHPRRRVAQIILSFEGSI